MEARERRPQPNKAKDLDLPVDIDKDKLKKAFDFSHFDINAILRGAELTLVGGTWDYSRLPAPIVTWALTLGVRPL